MKNKRAQGISVNTIIIAAIALIVLVVLIAIFTGYMGKWGGQLPEAEIKNCADLNEGRAVTGTACPEDSGLTKASGVYADVESGQVCCYEKE